jgi:hypothetical protein
MEPAKLGASVSHSALGGRSAWGSRRSWPDGRPGNVFVQKVPPEAGQ